MEQLINRSYKAIKDRGLITNKTKKSDFIKKLHEELYECELTQLSGYGKNKEVDYIEELIDLSTVCFMQVLHLGYDPIKEFEKVVIKNENRAKCTTQDQ